MMMMQLPQRISRLAFPVRTCRSQLKPAVQLDTPVAARLSFDSCDA